MRAERKRTAQLEKARRRITVDYAISGVEPGTLHDALGDLDEELAATRDEVKRLKAAAQRHRLGVLEIRAAPLLRWADEGYAAGDR